MSILSDNTVQYTIFSSVSTPSDVTDNLITTIYHKLSPLLSQYIWQYQPFNLQYLKKPVNCVQGITCYEDNVEDEWFIIYLLRELTAKNDQFAAQVEDFDGEPLLIEAAEHLPRWLKPEKAKNRIFLYRGKVHCIPEAYNPDRNLEESLKILFSGRVATECSDAIQDAINQKLSCFPKAVQDQKHRARCFVPSAIVALLERQPGLISSATRAFYLRDYLDTKICRTMKYFPPESRVLRNITFTKCLYAQLISQKYTPEAKVGWNLPNPKSPEFRAYDLGMKIACGFEILVSKAKGVNSPTTQAHGNSDKNQIYPQPDNCKDDKWLRMLKNLEELGYFEPYIKGSKQYDEKLKAAFEFYWSSYSEPDSNRHLGDRILEMLKIVQFSQEAYEAEVQALSPEDSDDWINLDQDKLDQLLSAKFNCTQSSVAAGKPNLPTLAQTIPEAFRSFVNYNASGVEGAEAPSQLKPVSFDAEKLADNLASILSLKVPHSDSDASSSSGMSVYDEKDLMGLNSDDEDELSSLKAHDYLKESKADSYVQDDDAKKYAQEMKRYMKQMDKELESTNVGKTFSRSSPKSKAPPLATGESDEDDLEEEEKDDDDDDDDDSGQELGDDEEDNRVKTDINTLANILESFENQEGLSGPSSTILTSMGIQLPRVDNQ